MIKVIDKKTILTKNIDIPYETKESDTSANFYADKVGKYPYVVFQGMVIETDQVKFIKLSNDNFLPLMLIKFEDKSGKMQDINFPLDNAIISIFIKSSTEVLNPIRMDFKVIDYNITKLSPKGNDLLYTMNCILNVDEIYYTPFKSYKGTSFNTIKTIAKELGLGFATNITDTNDSMTWINPRTTYSEFIKDVTDHSYINDSSFVWSFVDFYYNLNYVDIETELNEDPANYKQIASNFQIVAQDKNHEDKEIDLILTNHPDQDSSNVFISQYTLTNSSTRANMETGYRNIVRYYDIHTQNLSILELDSISTAGKDNNLIVLKDQPSDENGLLKNNYKDRFKGKIDTDNAHKNYAWSYQQNFNNIQYFQKINMKVVLKVANFNFYRFQNIKVQIYKIGDVQGNQNKEKNVQPYALNERLSGNWIITGINYIFDKEQGGNKQEINLCRRDLTAYQTEEKK